MQRPRGEHAGKSIYSHAYISSILWFMVHFHMQRPREEQRLIEHRVEGLAHDGRLLGHPIQRDAHIRVSEAVQVRGAQPLRSDDQDRIG